MKRLSVKGIDVRSPRREGDYIRFTTFGQLVRRPGGADGKCLFLEETSYGYARDGNIA